MANDRLDRPFGAFDHQEDSSQLAYLQHQDLTLPVFLPHLRLPHPTNCLDQTRPNPWNHDAFLSSRLDPTRPPCPPNLYPAEYGVLDDFPSPISLLPGNPFVNIAHVAPREHETAWSTADVYLGLPHDNPPPFEATGHGTSQGRLPGLYPGPFTPSVDSTTLPNLEAALEPTTPSVRDPTRHRPSLPSFLETTLYSPNTTTAPPTMPPRKRNSTAIEIPSSSPSAPAAKRPRRSVPSSDPLEKDSGDESDIIDLRDLSKVPEMLLQRQKEKAERVRLGEFQCAICMDYATTLTVTHCGHLFCADCLTTALKTEAQRHKCPMCRQKIESKARDAYKQSTKGFWPLELKLMTAKRKDKKADT